jgi:hypothetical protein
MERGTLILKKVAAYASSRMPMDVCGKDLVGICISITFNQIE